MKVNSDSFGYGHGSQLTVHLFDNRWCPPRWTINSHKGVWRVEASGIDRLRVVAVGIV